MARLGRKRLSMDIPTNIHDELRQMAKVRNITITKLVLRILLVDVMRERGIMSSGKDSKKTDSVVVAGIRL